MLKRLAAVAIASFACLAFAQTVTPTHGPGVDQFDHGANSAAVQQNVNLILPPAVALHLDVSELDFDMGLLGSPDAEFVCVYGNSLEDTNGGVFNNQRQWLPLGTSYGVGSDWSSSSEPAIEILNANGLVGSYPPAAFDDDGELIPGSKNHFVCYQTFILQKFSNHSGWSLSASRAGDAGFDMYIQDNTICTFNANQATGFFRIRSGDTVNLLPSTLTADTTGNLADGCEQVGKSWLDDLVVIAVKVNGDPHGTNTAEITYTISAEAPR